MKKSFVIACAFAAVVGCQKAEMGQLQENGGVKVPLKITASIESTVKTTMTKDGGVLKSAWTDGDKIYVQQCSSTEIHEHYDAIEYSVNVSGGVAEFVADGSVLVNPGSTGAKYFAMYPELMSGLKVHSQGFSMSAEQTQSASGDLTHIEEANILVAFPTSVDWNQNPVTVDLEFRHVLSVLELDLKASSAGVKISKINVTVTGGSDNDYLVVTSGNMNLQNSAGGTISASSGVNALTLNLAEPVELLTDEFSKFYMTITPGHAGQTFTVAAVTDKGETLDIGSMKVPEDASIPQGQKAVKSFVVQAP